MSSKIDYFQYIEVIFSRMFFNLDNDNVLNLISKTVYFLRYLHFELNLKLQWRNAADFDELYAASSSEYRRFYESLTYNVLS